VILVDTSVWVDHFRTGHSTLVRLLEDGVVLGHPWIIGELALGHLSERHEVIRLLGGLPQATVATEEEIMTLIDRDRLYYRMYPDGPARRAFQADLPGRRARLEAPRGVMTIALPGTGANGSSSHRPDIEGPGGPSSEDSERRFRRSS
jgi:hypothetical protein